MKSDCRWNVVDSLSFFDGNFKPSVCLAALRAQWFKTFKAKIPLLRTEISKLFFVECLHPNSTVKLGSQVACKASKVFQYFVRLCFGKNRSVNTILPALLNWPWNWQLRLESEGYWFVHD